MDRRRTLPAMALSAVLAVSAIAPVVAQDETGPEASDADRSLTGTITVVDGTWYITPAEGDPIELTFGPAWFDDLTALFGVSDGDTEVTLGGNLRDGTPSENASETAKEKAGKKPVIKVKTVNDQKRAKGKPPWTGGPKVQGEAHPGYEGWSKGQAKKAAGSANKPDVPTPNEVAKSNGKGGGPRIPKEED